MLQLGYNGLYENKIFVGDHYISSVADENCSQLSF